MPGHPRLQQHRCHHKLRGCSRSLTTTTTTNTTTTKTHAGVISSPNVAFNGFGYPAFITAPAGGLLTLRSLWLTSAWDEENEVTISAGDERGQTVGEYVTTLSTDNPREINFAALPAGSYKGTFAGVKHIGIDTWATQVGLTWLP